MKLLSLFTGIGAFEKALKNIGVHYELVGFSEIDKYAIKSYCAVHNVDESLNLGDITQIKKEKLPRFIDMITHGSPCQDFSIAGKQEGGDKGTETRSSLMWNTVDIVEWCLPKYVVWENVKNLLSKKHKHNFDSYIEIMDKLGYNSYYQVLNAKDYGIPQNRERVYTISIRKDIDTGYTFPEKEELKLRLKDMLEDEVEEKYYLSEEQVERMKTTNYVSGKYEQRVRKLDGICSTLAARDWKDPKCVQVGTLDMKGIDQIKRVYSDEGIGPTLSTMQGGNRQPKIIQPKLTNNDARLKSLVEKTNFEEGKVLNLDTYNQTTNENVSQTLTEPHHNTQRLFDGYRIRKLTPKECWRLMGFDDEDFEKAANVPTSNTQLYKQAGNSIVVNVLEKIFINLFKED